MQRLSFSFGILFLLASAGLAENGAEGWLRYARLDAATASKYSSLPEVVIVLNNSLLVKTAQAELLRGVHGMLDRTLRVSGGVPRNAAIVVGTVNQVRGLEAGFKPGANLRGDAYALICAQELKVGKEECLVLDYRPAEASAEDVLDELPSWQLVL